MTYCYKALIPGAHKTATGWTAYLAARRMKRGWTAEKGIFYMKASVKYATMSRRMERKT